MLYTNVKKGIKPMDDIRAKFNVIEDPRHQGYVKHPLSNILIIVMLAVLCGLDELSEIMTFAEGRKTFLKEKYQIETIPSKPTVCRVLNLIRGEVIAEIIIDVMKTHTLDLGEFVTVDGKAIRSTSKKQKGNTALQILTAYCTESGVVLGQRTLDEKTNEIPIFQEMLTMIDFEGKILTADALHCTAKKKPASSSTKQKLTMCWDLNKIKNLFTSKSNCFFRTRATPCLSMCLQPLKRTEVVLKSEQPKSARISTGWSVEVIGQG